VESFVVEHEWRRPDRPPVRAIALQPDVAYLGTRALQERDGDIVAPVDRERANDL
jgi:hypothetical protein